MSVLLRRPYEDLTFMAPLSEVRAERLAEFLARDLDGVVFDVGCGWAELLLRVLTRAPSARGVGVDADLVSVEHGRRLADDRGLTERVTLLQGDAKTTGPAQADAVICIGASQIWGPPVEDNQPLDYGSALAAIRAIVPTGARVVYGEGIWSRPPTPQAVAPLSGRLDELVSLRELIDVAVAHDFAAVFAQEATLDEWDEFESGYCARYAWWLREHGLHHEDAAEVQSMAAKQRAAYFSGYRGTMGMAYLALVAV